MGEQIALVPTVGLFVTMNPGYAGRTELPENLKALFRPCAMVVPDFALICEIMLVAEGFQEARVLARKFITLYTLCRELLSQQDHYDWGLRAIKSVLVVAGSLRVSSSNILRYKQQNNLESGFGKKQRFLSFSRFVFFYHITALFLSTRQIKINFLLRDLKFMYEKAWRSTTS